MTAGIQPDAQERSPHPAFRVDDPGLFTTVQDLGRTGRYSSGVPTGGAMDRFALAAANRLVGNEPGAAALEATLAGPALTAVHGCLVAVTGGDLAPELGGRPVSGWTSFFMAAGDQLRFGRRRSGARAYIAVAGGFDGDRWLGSRSTYLLVGRGGMHGRQLEAGDELRRLAPPAGPAVVGRSLPPHLRPRYRREPELRCVPGPHARTLGRAERERWLAGPWQVSREADRMGYRLEGPALQLELPELISFGLAMGCVQVPPSGLPILLLADHQTAGGYPVIATVASADLPLAAQLLPGDAVRFREIGVVEAQEAARAQSGALATLR